MAHILKLATAVPTHRYSQQEIFNLAQKVYGERGHSLAPFESAFFNTGIEQRYLAADAKWYLKKHSWKDRNELYITSALDLLEEAVLKAVEPSGYKMGDFTDIITVSTTGVATPSLDAMLMDRLQLNPQIRRTPIFGLGCAGGVLGLKRADQIAKENPRNIVLLLVVELCSLNFMSEDFSKQNVIATALFSDGAAAAVIAQNGQGPFINNSLEHRWPGSLDIMGWSVADEGMEVVFSRSIPDLVKNDFPEVYKKFLKEAGLERSCIDHFLSHPGGAKVIDELEKVFEVSRAEMKLTREVLSNFGNMSAPTVLFVLKRAIESGIKGKAVLSTFGPGFTTALMEVDF